MHANPVKHIVAVAYDRATNVLPTFDDTDYLREKMHDTVQYFTRTLGIEPREVHKYSRSGLGTCRTGDRQQPVRGRCAQ